MKMRMQSDERMLDIKYVSEQINEYTLRFKQLFKIYNVSSLISLVNEIKHDGYINRNMLLEKEIQSLMIEKSKLMDRKIQLLSIISVKNKQKIEAKPFIFLHEKEEIKDKKQELKKLNQFAKAQESNFEKSSNFIKDCNSHINLIYKIAEGQNLMVKISTNAIPCNRDFENLFRDFKKDNTNRYMMQTKEHYISKIFVDVFL